MAENHAGIKAMLVTEHSVQPLPVNCSVPCGLSKSLCWGNSLLPWLTASNLSWEGAGVFLHLLRRHVAFGLLCSINMVYWFPLTSSLVGATLPESDQFSLVSAGGWWFCVIVIRSLLPAILLTLFLRCLSGFGLKVTLASESGLESILSSFTFVGEFMKICIFILKCLVELVYKSFVLPLPSWLFF